MPKIIPSRRETFATQQSLSTIDKAPPFHQINAPILKTSSNSTRLLLPTIHNHLPTSNDSHEHERGTNKLEKNPFKFLPMLHASFGTGRFNVEYA
mmetsp:Transcript_1324/g.1902  ORF Transcript_1324/g.1902 Transcript_1324/m.1902 type:complete len:95 (-) Transcript_1324:182-466(-)